MENKLFDTILNTFENDDIRLFAKNCIDAAPEYWHHVPASSTGKYHPDYALGDGGLVRHTIALVIFLNYMLGIDCIKTQYDKSKWTRFDHPLAAARYVQSIDWLSHEEKVYIGMAISSHMGQWNTDKRHPETVLPKPESKAQIILHLADYLASRKDIEVKFDGIENVSSNQQSLPNINTWKFSFGKFEGKTIPEIAAEAPWYIKWAKKELTKEPEASLVRSFEG